MWPKFTQQCQEKACLIQPLNSKLQCIQWNMRTLHDFCSSNVLKCAVKVQLHYINSWVKNNHKKITNIFQQKRIIQLLTLELGEYWYFSSATPQKKYQYSPPSAVNNYYKWYDFGFWMLILFAVTLVTPLMRKIWHFYNIVQILEA